MGLSQQIGASSLIKPGVINSAAQRPASPYEGQVIFQKDTDEILAYNGSAWTRPANMPWGVIGYSYSTAGNVTLNTSSADIAGASVTFTAVLGRLYKVSYNAQIQKISTSGFVEVFITNAAGTVLYDFFTSVSASNHLNYSMNGVLTGLSGSVTIKARGVVESGTATIFRNINNPTSFVVEDIGPA